MIDVPGITHHTATVNKIKIRILTLNLSARNGSWVNRRSVLIQGFRALQPDLIALQEAIKTDEYDQAIDLLGPEWNVAHQQARDAEGMGISIASRWPLGEIQELTPTIDALYVPNIDEALDEEAAKREFWSAFRVLGRWWEELPPY